MEKVNIVPDEIVELTKRLIEIHRKWIIDGADDAADVKNEEAGLIEQQAAVDEFAAQRGLLNCVRSKLSAAICQFLVGGPTGHGDGPLVDNVTEEAYRAFAVRLSDVIAAGRDPCEIFAPFLEGTGADIKAQVARELYAALEGLGACPELLSIISSWHDTLDDVQVLSMLREYNVIGRHCTGRSDR